MALTDLKIRAFKSKSKRYKESDGEGLQLHIETNGSKLWRLGKFPVSQLRLKPPPGSQAGGDNPNYNLFETAEAARGSSRV